MTSWWRRRGLRARLVLAAAVPFAVALVVVTIALALLFAEGRTRDLDAQTRTAADALTALVSSGQLPPVLPLPAGSPLLAQVVGADGSVLAASTSASRVEPLMDSVGQGQRGTVTDEEGSYAGVPLRERVTPTTYDGRSVRVVVAAPLGDVRRALHALRLVLLVVVPVLVVLTTSLVYAVTGLALRPVERLRAAAQELATHPDRPAELPLPPGNDEIAHLAATLNGLLGALQSLVAQQRTFIADAAHELRSPLSALRVQLEVAQSHPTTVELPQLLDDLGQEVDRLAHLVDDLLALSRAEAGAGPSHVPLDLRRLAGAEGDAGPVLGDPVALGRLIDNLLANARRYASVIEVTCTRNDTTVLLDVDDDGHGIPTEDRERVFHRWVRLDDSRSRDGGGAGLGLALAREIARQHGGSLTVLDSPLGGARLRLQLPLAPGSP